MSDLAEISLEDKKKYLYIWIDILGFSDILRDENKYSELIDLIEKFRDKFEANNNTEQTLTISDGIVLIFRLSSIEVILNIFEEISKIQKEFIIENKYFLRGGMAIGTIQENTKNKDLKFLISNGLSKAYNLESKFVKYPVIALDDKGLKDLKDFFKIINNNEETFGLIKAHANSSINNKYIYFIDFIDKEFKELIEINLKKYQSFPQVLDKYIWLFRYFCEKFELENIKNIGGIRI